MIRRFTALAVLAGGLVGLAALTGCAGAAAPGTWHTAPDGGTGGGGTGGGQIVQAVARPTGTTPPAEGAVLTGTGSGAVALTFDDGPDPTYTPAILGLLRQHGVKATFCVIGANVRSHPELVQAIARDGHTLCNHSWGHDLNLGRRTPETVRSDLARTNDEIHRAVPGAPIKYFRHPGGNFTPLAVKTAADLGMKSIGWDVDTRDWETGRLGTGAAMCAHVVATVQQSTRAGSVVLAHDGGGDRSGTEAAFRTLLPWLKATFTLVALPD